MATERLVSAAAYGDSYNKPLSGVLHHHRGHDRRGSSRSQGMVPNGIRQPYETHTFITAAVPLPRAGRGQV